MNINEIREYQLNFDSNKSSFLKLDFENINRLRLKFVNDYPLDIISNFTFDEYVIGKREPTFCNRIENELNAWGDIHNSAATKFGVYFGRRGSKERKYQFTKRFGSNLNDAFNKLKFSICELIKNHENHEELKKNPISPMFKGKILSVYFPDEFLNIFSATHLNYFINILGLENYSKSELDKQKVLLTFKNSNSAMKDWSIYEFNRFLYFSFGRPNDEAKDKDLSKEVEDFKMSDFPPIEEVSAEIVSLGIVDNERKRNRKAQKSRKIDYSKRQTKLKRIGDRGEQVVVQLERNYLRKNGRPDLAKKVDHIAKTDDSAGYDILSFELTGKAKYIEVKSTLKPIGVSLIYLTSNELEVAKIKENYCLYIVYDIGKINPKIWKTTIDELIKNEQIEISPILYRINMKTKN